ncbi:hypothetical protein BA192_07855 [Yersinia pseudotuberculosis]|uniref:hypothetical protein n=1 Tax=Yersinia pseudotuberculosis TaxID=633 RepID=UPI000D0B6DD7|nr:hypothetical protein [Yersinia pseudotuberculosis]PSH38345.1 hypothetical protein BA192_07855 [Yersinia pseudotuberculosis]
MSELIISEIKSRAEFFKKGSIIPQRIFKGRRKTKHFIVFGSDSWVIPTHHGYVVMVDSRNSDCAIRINWRKNYSSYKQLIIYGSPYFHEGTTKLEGNFNLSDHEWAANVALWLRERS